MIASNPEALRYILQEDLYLLQSEKDQYLQKEEDAVPELRVTAEEPVHAPVNTPAPPPQPITAIPKLQAVAETQKVVYKYLGQNKKGFLILVNYTNAEHIAEPHLKALESTLVRKGSGLDDTVVLNLAKYPAVTYADLINEFKPEKILLLGAGAIPTGLSGVALNQIVNIGDKQVLYSYGFAEMMGNKDKTRAFWEQMKNL